MVLLPGQSLAIADNASKVSDKPAVSLRVALLAEAESAPTAAGARAFSTPRPDRQLDLLLMWTTCCNPEAHYYSFSLFFFY